jgi:hypothetical protein
MQAKDGGAGAAMPGGGSGAGAPDAGGAALLHTVPARTVVTGVRGVGTPDATQTMQLVNDASGAATVDGLSLGGVSQVASVLGATTQDAQVSALVPASPLLQVEGPPPLPVSIAGGAQLPVVVHLLTTAAGLPAAPPQDNGATLLSTTLTVTSGSTSVKTDVFGVVLTQALWEPTLGQILYTLGYKLNVGMAQNNANPNRGKTAQQLPGVEAGTDEIAAPLFVKSGAAEVTLIVVARFSPMGPLPFGWYPSGASATHNVVGTMAEITDAQTSNKSRMVQPPMAAGSGTTFDPGTQTFGIWVYTDELSQKFDTGTASNGDFAYSQDALNSPANVHRFKVYPLKDAAGAPITNSYLLAVEEASNGDYQDYVFVLGNVAVAH